MGTTLHRMTAAGYERFRAEAVAGYAAQNVESGRWPCDGAVERARVEHDRLLPQGLATPAHHLFTVHDEATGQAVGALWLAVSEHEAGRSGYVYNVAIDAAHRRRGHGRGAFLALEAIASELGLTDIGLHVFAYNEPALALYRGLGFQVTGINMLKRLETPGSV